MARSRRVGFAALGVGRCLFDLDARVLGQSPRRLGKGEPFDLHHEVEDVSLLFAAEAIEKAPLGVDAEARRLLAMKRAQAQIASPLARELHRFGHDRHDLDAVANRLDGLR